MKFLSLNAPEVVKMTPSVANNDENFVRMTTFRFQCSLWFAAVSHKSGTQFITWWRHQMETFSALLAICAGNSPVTGEFPTQRPVTRSFDVFFDLRLFKRLSKQWWRWWFETPPCPLWRYRNVDNMNHCNQYKIAAILQAILEVHFAGKCKEYAFTLRMFNPNFLPHNTMHKCYK